MPRGKLWPSLRAGCGKPVADVGSKSSARFIHSFSLSSQAAFTDDMPIFKLLIDKYNVRLSTESTALYNNNNLLRNKE
jgi:hypothetical protein